MRHKFIVDLEAVKSKVDVCEECFFEELDIFCVRCPHEKCDPKDVEKYKDHVWRLVGASTYREKKGITLNEYQEKAGEFQLESCENPYYLGLGLAGESGEVCDKLKRIIRGDGAPDDIVGELGDVLWYVSRLADLFGISFDEVAEKNIAKLTSRKKAGTIAGTGDYR